MGPRAHGIVKILPEWLRGVEAKGWNVGLSKDEGKIWRYHGPTVRGISILISCISDPIMGIGPPLVER